MEHDKHRREKGEFIWAATQVCRRVRIQPLKAVCEETETMNAWLFDALDLMKPGRKYHCQVGRHRLELRLADASSERFPLIELDETNVLLEDWVELPFAGTEAPPLGHAETPPGG